VGVGVGVCVHMHEHIFGTFPLLNQLVDSIALGVDIMDWRTPQHCIFHCPVVTKKNPSGCVNL